VKANGGMEVLLHFLTLTLDGCELLNPGKCLWYPVNRKVIKCIKIQCIN
jgi:hypothetical protein